MELKAIEIKPQEDWCGQRYVLNRLYGLQGDIELMLRWAMESVRHLPDPRLDEDKTNHYYDYLWDHLATCLSEGRVSPERLIRWCGDVLRIPRLHQPYRVRTQYLMAEVYHAMNDEVKVGAMLTSIGAPHENDWMVIGPFDASEENRFPETPPFELCMNLTAPRIGILNREIQWESWKDEKPMDGLLNILLVFNQEYYGQNVQGLPLQLSSGHHFPIPAIVYSCIYVDVPKAVDVQVWTGSPLMRVWLNDNPSPVIEVNAMRTAILDNELSNVSLVAGLNRFLIATVSGSFSFYFYFRITDDDGNPIPGLKFVSAREVPESR